MPLETQAVGVSVSDRCHICRWPSLRCPCADALPLPDRTDTGAAEEVEPNIRVLPGDHTRQDDRRTGLVARGPKCGPGAVGERCASSLPELFRFGGRKAERPQGWAPEVQAQKVQSAVVSP